MGRSDWAKGGGWSIKSEWAHGQTDKYKLIIIKIIIEHKKTIATWKRGQQMYDTVVVAAPPLLLLVRHVVTAPPPTHSLTRLLATGHLCTVHFCPTGSRRGGGS